ncbi:MAG TPA: hypothetical protein VK440_00050 [Burkholderiales bacterium]|nr:hypothetical protein [Burkholderiales bacterium]
MKLLKLWVLVAFLLVAVPGIAAQEYSAQPGPFAVGKIDDIVLHDPQRNRDVPIKVYYPEASGIFPVLIFSHGAGGSKDGYSYFGEYFASHGYVCIHPTHYGSDTTMLHKGRPLLNLRAMKQIIANPDNWINRPLDVSFIIDSLPTLANKAPALAGKVDPSKIGASGHSFGAYTVMALAGAKVEIPSDGSRTFPDKRIQAFVAISPQGVDEEFHEGAWNNITVPLMSISGSQDRGMGGQNPGWRKMPYEAMPAGDKFLIYIFGATHMAFARGADMPGTEQLGSSRADTPRGEDIVKIAALAFFDSYLRGKKDGLEFLMGQFQKKQQEFLEFKYK